MDHEDNGVNLGLVRVPVDSDSDSGNKLVEQIDQIIYKFAPSLPSETRRNFEEQMEIVKRAASLLDLDQVTGLLNRRAATHYYHKVLGRSRNIIGLILADVDDFKEFNGLYTRAGGDKVLTAIGKILQEKAREEEITIARLGEGADEFLGIIRTIPDRQTFERIVCRIGSALNSPEVQKEAGYQFDHRLCVSVSCALVTLYGDDRRPYAKEIGEKVYRKLSLAVDQAKHIRKGSPEEADGEMVIPMVSLAVHKGEVSQVMEKSLLASTTNQ